MDKEAARGEDMLVGQLNYSGPGRGGHSQNHLNCQEQ